MKKKLSTLILLVIFPISNTYAEKVEPEFTGEWYAHFASNTDDLDSCLNPTWNYQYKSKDKNDVITKRYVHDQADYDFCKWQEKPFFVKKVPDKPIDFPSDYDELKEPQTEKWRAYCKNDKGEIGMVWEVNLYPIYKCPNGIAYTNNETKEGKFCSTSPKVCMSDVVGRDLNTAIGSFLGHVGLTTNFSDTGVPGRYVLEVLSDDPKIINIHSLESFKNIVPGKYWGEVYDLPGINISRQTAYNIFTAGLNQQKFSPEYTYSSHWQEGSYLSLAVYDQIQNKFVDEQKIIKAKFRCDTFVYYCYLKVGLNIPLSLDVILPRTLFNSFLHKRTDTSSKKSAAYYHEKEIVNELNNDLNEGNIAKLDRAMIAYLKNPNFSHQHKLNTLLTQLKTRKDYETYSYILDNIAFLSSPEVIPDLIKEYQNEQNIKKKIKLLSAITDSTRITDSKKVDSIQIKNIHLAQNLMINILQSEANFSLLHEAIFDSLSVLPMNKENYTRIVEAMNKLELDGSNQFDADKKNFYLFAMAFANNDMQKWLLPRLINSVSKNDRATFDKQLYSIMKELVPSNIEKEAKLSIEKYIKASLPKAINKNITYNQLYILATVTSETVKERDAKLLNSLMVVELPKTQVDLINNLDKKLLQHLSKDEKRKIHDKLSLLLDINPDYKYEIAYLMQITN